MVIQQVLLGFTLYFMKKTSKWKSLHTGIKVYQKSQFSSQNLTHNGFNQAQAPDHAQSSM